MFQKGQWVIYGSAGVCHVEEVGRQEGGGLDREKDYYRLSPMLDSSVIFAPVDTRVFLRPVMSREEANILIGEIPQMEEAGRAQGRDLDQRYRAALDEHDCRSLLSLIHLLHGNREDAVKAGKKPRQADLRYMKRAEELLHSELSVALELPYQEIASDIRHRMETLCLSV